MKLDQLSPSFLLALGAAIVSISINVAYTSASVSASSEAVTHIPPLEERLARIETRADIIGKSRDQFQAETKVKLDKIEEMVNQILVRLGK